MRKKFISSIGVIVMLSSVMFSSFAFAYTNNNDALIKNGAYIAGYGAQQGSWNVQTNNQANNLKQTTRSRR